MRRIVLATAVIIAVACSPGRSATPAPHPSTPLVFVDGQPFVGSLDTLSNIESIEVIKGQAAVARYGRAGHNGVVFVRRKQPKH